MEIYVVRHTHLNIAAGVCYGQTEVPVADSFTEEVANIREQLPLDLELTFSSSAERCVKLASALNFEPVIKVDALKEMNFGLWENKRWDDINRQDLDAWCNDFVKVRPPAGENLCDVYERVSSFLVGLQKERYGKVLIVTHAGVIRCVNAFYNAVELKNLFDFNPEFGVVYRFDSTC